MNTDAKTITWMVIVVWGLGMVYVGSRIEWWYHEESGVSMAGTLSDRLDRERPHQTEIFASEICGERLRFESFFPDAYWSAMPEQAISRHFTLYGQYRNIIWMALGMKDRFCLARFEIAMRRHDCAWPFPYCNRYSWQSLDEVRLIDRITTRPAAPPGVRALFPGECVTGELAAGTSARFQVEIPGLGQRLKIVAFGDNRRDGLLEVEIEKNGQALGSYRRKDYVDEPAGGTYQILLRAPPQDMKRYLVLAYWGYSHDLCAMSPEWRRTDEVNPPQEEESEQ